MSEQDRAPRGASRSSSGTVGGSTRRPGRCARRRASAASPGPAGAPRRSTPPLPTPTAELAAQVGERTADLQRVTAEYANYRRRVDRDREAVLVTARTQFVSELLTVLDDLDRAEAHGDLTGAFKAVADKITSVVQKLGLEPFGLVGEPFDPAVHEAVQHDTARGRRTDRARAGGRDAARLPHGRPGAAPGDGRGRRPSGSTGQLASRRRN